jgi:pimeloyl-ACP methyl ester carboxylesterase
MLRASAFLLSSAVSAHAILPPATAEEGAPGFEERSIQSQLDHFDPAEHRTWKHRYLFNDTNWDGRGKLPNGCKGPILLYTGNEGNIEAFWGSNGFMTEVLAPKLGGMLLFPEQRYYGKSLPFGPTDSFTPQNARYLTTEQVLADYNELLEHVKATVDGAANCPVVAFGGSYGGTLTTFMRLKYPAAVVGGLAASAPIGYYDPAGWAAHGVSEYTWADIVARDYDEAHPLCSRAIQDTIDAIDAAPTDDVVRAFHACDRAALGPGAPSQLFSYALESIPQQDYPYAIGANPAWPVNATCAALVAAQTSAEAKIDAAAALVKQYVGLPADGSCLPALDEGPGGVPGDGPGGVGAWSYQSCTENLHMFSSRGAVRDYKFDLNAVHALCDGAFNGTVRPTPSGEGSLTSTYGGWGIPTSGVSNIIWSNGKLDPWSGGGFLTPGDPASGNHWFLMDQGAHHLDLRGPHPEDPPQVTEVRRQELLIITKWIHEAGAAL